MAARKKYKTSEDVLDAIFPLPSDVDNSDDNLDGCSGSDDEDHDAEVRLRTTTESTDASDDDSDDDILYRLASSDATDDSYQTEASESTDCYYDSADDEEARQARRHTRARSVVRCKSPGYSPRPRRHHR